MRNKITFVIMLGIIGFLLVKQCETGTDLKYVKAELQETGKRLKSALLDQDELTEVVKGQYRKMVADTLTIGELEKLVKDRELELENRKPSTVIEFVTDTIEIEREVIIEKDSTFTDYFPNSKDPFITYKVDLIKRNSSFRLEPIDILVSLSQDKEGGWYGDVKLPSYLTVKELTIQSTPIANNKEPKPPRGLQFLAGAEYTYDDRTISPFIGVEYRSLGIKVGSSSAGLFYKF